jgi:hypothetical protein
MKRWLLAVLLLGGGSLVGLIGAATRPDPMTRRAETIRRASSQPEIRRPQTIEPRHADVARRVLRGRVFASHRAVAHAFVQAKLGGVVFARSRTGRDGGFVLPDAPADHFDLEIRHPRHPVLRFDDFRPGAAEEHFHLEPRQGIAGTVVDRRGEAVVNAVVQVWRDGERHVRLVTGPDGAFRLSCVDRGSLEVAVLATAGGHRPSGRLPVRPGDEAIRLELEPGLAISGSLPRPATEGCWLEVVDSSGGVVLRKMLRPGQERFRIGGLGAERYVVRFYHRTSVLAERMVRGGAADVAL